MCSTESGVTCGRCCVASATSNFIAGWRGSRSNRTPTALAGASSATGGGWANQNGSGPTRTQQQHVLMFIARRHCHWRPRSVDRLYRGVATMEQRDYAVGFDPYGCCTTKLMRTGCGRGVEHAAVQLCRCRCNTEIGPGHEPAGDSGND